MKTSKKIIRSTGALLTLIAMYGLFTSLLVFRNHELLPVYQDRPEISNPDQAQINKWNNNESTMQVLSVAKDEDSGSELEFDEELKNNHQMPYDYYDDFTEPEPVLEDWMFDLNYYENYEEEGPVLEDWTFDNTIDTEIGFILTMPEEPDYDVLEIMHNANVILSICCEPFLNSLLVSSPNLGVLVNSHK